MTTKPIDDGGPAFPVAPQLGPARPGEWASAPIHPGMSLRDWFAGQAMAALIVGYDHEARMKSIDKNDRTGFDDCPHHDSDSTYASLLSVEAYIIADAMIAALKNRGAE